MALTNAEKQKLYRERHYGLNPAIGYSDDHEILHRLQTNLGSLPNANLKRLLKVTGMNKREIVEKAINELAERLDCNHDKY